MNGQINEKLKTVMGALMMALLIVGCGKTSGQTAGKKEVSGAVPAYSSNMPIAPSLAPQEGLADQSALDTEKDREISRLMKELDDARIRQLTLQEAGQKDLDAKVKQKEDELRKELEDLKHNIETTNEKTKFEKEKQDFEVERMKKEHELELKDLQRNRELDKKILELQAIQMQRLYLEKILSCMGTGTKTDHNMAEIMETVDKAAEKKAKKNQEKRDRIDRRIKAVNSSEATAELPESPVEADKPETAYIEKTAEEWMGEIEKELLGDRAN